MNECNQSKADQWFGRVLDGLFAIGMFCFALAVYMWLRK